MTPKELQKLYAVHRAQLLAYAQRRLGSMDEAEDVVQELFLDFSNRAMQTDFEPSNAQSYLRQMVRMGVMDYARKKARGREAIPESEVVECESPETMLLDRELAEQLRRAIALLLPREREVITRSYLQGMTMREIASAQGVSLSAVRRRLDRARSRLREKLKDMAPVQKDQGGLVVDPGRAVAPTEAQPVVIVVWDPELIGESEYAALVNAIGDLVRAEGGVGIERIRSSSFGVALPAGSLV